MNKLYSQKLQEDHFLINIPKMYPTFKLYCYIAIKMNRKMVTKKR